MGRRERHDTRAPAPSTDDTAGQNQKELGSSLLPSSSPLKGKGLEGQLTSLPWHWDYAELLQQAQCVHLEPMLDALAAHDAVDVDRRDRRLLASRGDAHKGAFLRSTHGQTGHHLFPFSDDVLNREVQIRESCQVHGKGLFGTRETAWRTGRGSMIDLIEGDEFVDGSPILLVEHFIVEATHAGLVYFS